MRVYYSIDEYAARANGARVALGFFDGVHEGHRAVLRRCAAEKGGNEAAALTFSQSPAQALGRQAPPLLTDNARKAELMAQLGIDAVIFADFGSLMRMSAEDFVRDILAAKLKAAGVYCGYDYRFGAGGSGDADALARLCAREGIEVGVEEPFVMDGDAVSSTRIRAMLAGGDIAAANRLLGSRYTVSGRVGGGNRIGRGLGFPTINLPLGEGLCVPRYGVYAARVTVGGGAYRAAVNIGVHPTVGEAERPVCECFLLDFGGGELYGESAVCELIGFVRPEMRFADGDALRAQIAHDVVSVRKMTG